MCTGNKVLTLFGSGTVLSFRAEDNTYQVQLPYGIGFLRPSVVIGAEQLSVSALEAIGVTYDEAGDEYINGMKRSTPAPGTKLVSNPSSIFFGNQMSYTFFRLHHTLYWRLVLARRIANESFKPGTGSSKTGKVPENMQKYDDINGKRLYMYVNINRTPTLTNRQTYKQSCR